MSKKDKTLTRKESPRHAATPWSVHPDDALAVVGADWREGFGAICRMNKGAYVAEAEKGNAALIVRAVNAHQGLIEAASILLAEMMANGMDDDENWSPLMDKLAAALKLAGEGE